MDQPGKKLPGTAEDEQHPLFAASTVYTWERARTMNRELAGPSQDWLSAVIAWIFLAAADYSLLSDSGSPLGYVFLAAALASVPLLHALFAASARKVFESSRSTLNQETRFSLFEDHFEARREGFFARMRYGELEGIIEGKDSFYLMVSAGQGYIVPKTDADEIAFLEARTTRRAAPSLLDRSVYILAFSAMLLSTFWSVAVHEMPADAVLRSWVEDAEGLFFLFMPATVILACTAFLRERAGRIQKKGRRVAASIAAVAGTLAASFLLLLSLLLSAFSYGDITENGNGTYTYAYTPWLDDTEYSLYQDGGPLYLQYLRPMTGPDDTDPAITREEWLEARSQELESSAGMAEESGSSASGEESAATEASATSTSETASGMRSTLQQVEDGYEGLYHAYFEPRGDGFEVSYTAKGEAFVILSDDGETVRYLMYDRDSANGSCGLYVLYEAKKEDGSSSSADAEILDMYAFEYATGATADSGRTSWSDAGSQEYLDLTGE